MLMNNMDEALDIKPTVTIEGKQLEMLKIESAAVGQVYQICAMANITNIRQDKGEDGITRNCITFELSNIELETEETETDLSGMYPNSPSAS